MFYGFGYDSSDTMISFVFLIIIGVIVVAVVKGVSQWNKDNNSPRLTVDAIVVNKKEEINQQQQANAGDITGAHGYHTTTSIVYYITFQVENGDRMDFSVDGRTYEMLLEGDIGRLSFQGSRYLGFEKENN